VHRELLAVLVPHGNKCALEELQQVMEELASGFAQKNGTSFSEAFLEIGERRVEAEADPLRRVWKWRFRQREKGSSASSRAIGSIAFRAVHAKTEFETPENRSAVEDESNLVKNAPAQESGLASLISRISMSANVTYRSKIDETYTNGQFPYVTVHSNLDSIL
jgi:hypothetical protein